MQRQYAFNIHKNGLTLSSHEPFKPSQPTRELKPTLHTRASRKAITSFTRQARSRFQSQWRMIDFSPYHHEEPNQPTGRGFLISLDYPPDAMRDKDEFRKDRNRLSQSMNREFKDIFQGALWKSELQKSGLLHWHLVTFFKEDQQTKDLLNTIKGIWTRIVDCHNIGFRYSGIDVRTLHGGHGLPALCYYLSKQPAPEGLEWNHGKCWGTFHKDRLPLVTPQRLEITEGWEEAYIPLMIQTLQEHPITSQIPKVKKLTTNWLGWSLDLDPVTLQEVMARYDEKAAELELYAS